MYIVIYKAGEYSPEKASRKEEAGKKIREWVNSMTVLLKGYDSHTTQQRKRRLLAEEKKRPAVLRIRTRRIPNKPVNRIPHRPAYRQAVWKKRKD